MMFSSHAEIPMNNKCFSGLVRLCGLMIKHKLLFKCNFIVFQLMTMLPFPIIQSNILSLLTKHRHFEEKVAM